MAKFNYELLSLAFSYPEEKLLEVIKEGVFDNVFGEKAPVPKNLEELEVEYCRLFVGPGPVEVPPYESVYRTPESEMQKGLVMGNVAFEVQNKYEEAGLVVKKDFTDMPDHIAVETLFVAYLEAMDNSYPEAGFMERKRQFIKNHLAEWGLIFAKEINKKGYHPWYIYIADQLAETIKKEMI